MNEFEWHLLEDRVPAESLEIDGVRVQQGGLVRLRPKAGGDIMDLALAGKIARVAAIEQDYEGRLHLAVVIAEDPGHDLGLMKQPGHQFFFEPGEVEPILAEGPPAPGSSAAKPARILVAGIGNIFLGDDGFGVEVIRRMQGLDVPAEVKLVDFGIRGYDLAYALLEPFETVILVDACPRGSVPGTLFLIEPDLNSIPHPGAGTPAFDAHTMNPMNVLGLAKSLGALQTSRRICLLGCEPFSFGPEEGQLGLSEAVNASVEGAVQLLKSTIARILAGENPGQAI